MEQRQTKIFFPNLDGLRFIAFISVFINHSIGCLLYKHHNKYYEFIRDRILMSGDMGVNLFFVLSGFLITYLLLKEKELNGRINIRDFYIRRVLRIWPVYFLVVALCLFVFPHFHKVSNDFPISTTISGINPWLYVSFLGNFDYLFHGITNVLIGILWSVSVEEQFYLFWPLLIAFTPKKHLLKLLLTVIAASIAFRFFCSNGGSAMIIKYHSLSSMSDLAIGAVLAYFSTKERFKDKVRNIPRWTIISVYMLFFILLPFRSFIWKFGKFYVHVASVAPVIFSCFFAFFILEQNYAGRSFFKLGRLKSISSLGKITYGMYCYHMLSIFLVLYVLHLAGVYVGDDNKYLLISEMAFSLLLTILVSKFSYSYFEKYFLEKKKRFARIVR